MSHTLEQEPVFSSFVRLMGVTAACVGVCIWLFHWNELRKAEGEQTVSDTAFIHMAEEALQREFQFSVTELDQLAGSPSLAEYLAAPSESSRRALESTMLNMLRATRIFDQLRWIDATGMERVRINADGGTPRAVPTSELQNKATRGYFKETIDLEIGHVFVSRLDLNVEHDEIERPYKPMLRFATPVDDDTGERRGVLIVNLLAQNVLDRVARLKGNHGEVHLLNSDGYWLFGPNAEVAWGFMFPTGPSFADLHADAWQDMMTAPSGVRQTDSGLITFARIHPMLDCRLSSGAATSAHDLKEDCEESEYAWELLTLVPSAKQRALTLGHARNAILQWALLMALLGPGCWFFATARQKQATALAELVRSEKRFASLTESVPDAILTVDDREKVVAWNRSADLLFGLESRDITGMPLSWLVRNTEPRGMQRLLALPPGETREMLGLHPSGADFPLEIAVGHWEEAGKRFTSLIARDITVRVEAELRQKKLRSELDQARKLESVGQLAAGIAHEINTPTQFVGDNTRFLKESFEDIADVFTAVREVIAALEAAEADDLAADLRKALEDSDAEFLEAEIPKALDQSIAGLERVSRIVRAMKEFAHPGQDAKAPTDLNRAIESTVTVATNEWKYACEMHLDFDEDLPQVTCHAGEVNQAVLNIVVNASHAVAEKLGAGATTKGNIWITTRLVDDYAEVRIRDDGSGIPEHVRPRIFDPFFTTKDVGKGTGQGLAIAHDVITNKHQGSLEFETEEGQGTTFVLRLPLQPSSDPIQPLSETEA
jgi:PAS domain S-box-containing protein